MQFLGTRGEIEARSRRHAMHSSLLIASGDCKVMIDCGADWGKRLRRISPTAILLTHAHSDHAAGLKTGCSCPVFATAGTQEILKRYPIREWRTIHPWQSFAIGPIAFEALPVEHSPRAPAVGFRICRRVFYVPDVAAIPERPRALGGVTLYIGDGATPARPILRKKPEGLIGHASILSQLEWCRDERVPCAIFTHCGSQIVAGDERRTTLRLRESGRRLGVRARLAYDGLRLVAGGETMVNRRRLP
ncbi:MAG TPA: MBL fold metallo-hydrolase [Bryobacteraceae bacterium]|nr:MBL fold metallo-hydrolase [Bryobacteraceae bacterium]